MPPCKYDWDHISEFLGDKERPERKKPAYHQRSAKGDGDCDMSELHSEDEDEDDYDHMHTCNLEQLQKKRQELEEDEKCGSDAVHVQDMKNRKTSSTSTTSWSRWRSEARPGESNKSRIPQERSELAGKCGWEEQSANK